MRREDKFRKELINRWEGAGHHVTHIESPLTSAGVPDLHVRANRRDYWIELKVEREDGIKLRPTQKLWHRKRSERDGASWVVTLMLDGFILITPGSLAHKLNHEPAKWRAVSGTCINQDLVLPTINKLKEEK